MHRFSSVYNSLSFFQSACTALFRLAQYCCIASATLPVMSTSTYHRKSSTSVVWRLLIPITTDYLLRTARYENPDLPQLIGPMGVGWSVQMQSDQSKSPNLMYVSGRRILTHCDHSGFVSRILWGHPFLAPFFATSSNREVEVSQCDAGRKDANWWVVALGHKSIKNGAAPDRIIREKNCGFLHRFPHICLLCIQ